MQGSMVQWLLRRIPQLIRRKVRVLLKRDIVQNFGPISVHLPPEHDLADNLVNFPRYDRFLPFLCSSFEKDSWIIDVGANCGDTVASIAAQGPLMNFIAIEPADRFFPYLTRNLKSLQEQQRLGQTLLFKDFIGLDLRGELTGKKGTKSLSGTFSEKDKVIKTRSIDEILFEDPKTEGVRSALTIGPAHKLLKSDVDGFDHQVVFSARKYLAASRSLIVYFECQHESDDQLKGYIDLFQELEKLDYLSYYLFDNYGNFLTRTTSSDQVEQLLRYVHRQNRQGATRTFYYYDILVCKEEQKTFIDNVLERYNQVVSWP